MPLHTRGPRPLSRPSGLEKKWPPRGRFRYEVREPLGVRASEYQLIGIAQRPGTTGTQMLTIPADFGILIGTVERGIDADSMGGFPRDRAPARGLVWPSR